LGPSLGKIAVEREHAVISIPRARARTRNRFRSAVSQIGGLPVADPNSCEGLRRAGPCQTRSSNMANALNQDQLSQIVQAVISALQVQGTAPKAASISQPVDRLAQKDRSLVAGFKRKGIPVDQIVLMNRADPKAFQQTSELPKVRLSPLLRQSKRSYSLRPRPCSRPRRPRHSLDRQLDVSSRHTSPLRGNLGGLFCCPVLPRRFPGANSARCRSTIVESWQRVGTAKVSDWQSASPRRTLARVNGSPRVGALEKGRSSERP
jgi:hypothetical protein